MEHDSSTQSAAQTLPETATNPSAINNTTSENAQPLQESRYEANYPLSNLHPDPNQIGTYGDPGGPHDPTFDDLLASIENDGIREPLLASRGNGEVRDGTIISGHRRYAAALRLNLESVPVRWITHRTADEASMARIDSNRQRVKNLWVRGMELREEKKIEVRRAKERQRMAGGARSGRRNPGPVTPSQGVSGRSPTVLEILAKREGHNKDTVALLQKLVELGCKDPSPSASAVAVALATATWSDIRTIAAKFGLGPTKAPPTSVASMGSSIMGGDGGITQPSNAAATATHPSDKDAVRQSAITNSPASTSNRSPRSGGKAVSRSSPTKPRAPAPTVTEQVSAADIPSGTGACLAEPTRHESAYMPTVPVQRGEPTAVVPEEKAHAVTSPGNGKGPEGAPRKKFFIPPYSSPDVSESWEPERPFREVFEALVAALWEVHDTLDYPIEKPDEEFLRESIAYVRCCLGRLEECFPEEAAVDW